MKIKIYGFFAVSYLLVFLIPIALNLQTQSRLFSVLEENAGKAELTKLYQCRDVMDAYFQELDAAISGISVNNTFRYLAYREKPSVNPASVSDILRAQELLAAGSVTSSLVDEYYLYLKNPGIHISTNHIFLDSDPFYGTFFSYDDMTAEQWRVFCERADFNRTFLPVASARVGSNTGDYLMYMQSFPLDLRRLGTFFIPLKVSRIVDMLSYDSTEDELICIADAAGNILLDTGGYEEEGILRAMDTRSGPGEQFYIRLDGADMLAFEVASEYCGLTYTIAVPKTHLTQQLHSERAELIYSLVIALVAGMLLVMALSYINGKPLSDTLVLIEGYSGDRSRRGYRDMSRFVAGLMDSNQSLRVRMASQLPLAKTFFVQRLLGERVPEQGRADGQRLEDMARQFDLRPLAGPLAAVLYNLYFPEDGVAEIREIYRVKQALNGEIAALFHNEDYFRDVDVTKAAFVVEAARDGETLQQLFSQLADSFHARHGMGVTFYVGSFCMTYAQLAQSIRDAMETFDIRPVLSEKSVWFYAHDYKPVSFYYPLSIEQKLINSASVGDFATVEEQLHQIYQENLVKRNLGHSMLKYLANELEGSLLKSVYRMDRFEVEEESFQQQLSEVGRSLTFQEKFLRITELYRQICQWVREDMKDRNEHLVGRITAHIQENYADPNLSLSSVAEAFGITGGYLSMLFRNGQGENFSAFVERLRIERACALLIEERTLETIAAQTGYNSVQVFRKAFRRQLGMNPNEYRKSAQAVNPE